jgi:hypothetical protein
VSADAPLNYGQLWSFRDIDRYPTDWRLDANLPAAWDLRGLELAAVTSALRGLTDRHEALRTTYHLSEGIPVQRVRPAAALPVEQVDQVVTDPGEPDRVKDELVRLPFPMTGELGWRGRLVTTDGAPMFLALSFSHLFLDVWSTRHLRDDFARLVAGANTDPHPGPTPRAVAARQRDAGSLARQADAERYWRRLLDDDIGECFPTLPARTKQPRMEVTLHSRRLGGLAAVAARRHRVSTASVVLSLVAAGLAHHLGTGRVTMSLMASNRFTPEYQSVVGTMNQLIPVVAEVPPESTIAELVKRLHWTGARAYRHSCYDTDRIAALAAERLAREGRTAEHDCWFNHLFRCWFNYVQLDGEVSDPADPAPASLVWTPEAQPYGQAFRVRVAVENGLTSVLLLADPGLLPRESAVGILRGLALGAQMAATDPHENIRALWTGQAHDLDPALFPAEVPAAS